MKRSNRLNEVANYTLSKVESMSRSDLAKATRVLTQAANKRLNRFKVQNITTPATAYIKKHGGRFSTSGMNVQELQAEFIRARDFLKAETSTIKGFRTWENKIADTLRTNAGIEYNQLNELEKRKFWKLYAKLEELDPANVHKTNYKTAVGEMYTAVKGGLKMKDIDAIAEKLNKKYYSERTKDFSKSLSAPFDIVNEVENNPFERG